MNDNAEITITLEEGETPMAAVPAWMDLVMKTGSESYQALMTDIQHNGAASHAILRFGADTKFNELGTLESRANSGVMATPIASPTTQV